MRRDVMVSLFLSRVIATPPRSNRRRKMKITICDGLGGTMLFEGERLAFKSSRERTGRRSRRWTDVEIYRTDAGEYIVHEIGRSTIEGESDRCRIVECPSGLDAFEALGTPKLTALDTDVLAAAADADEFFAKSLGDRHEVEDLSPAGISPLVVGELREYVLEREGDRALRFLGEEIGHAFSGDSDRAGLDVRIYRTRDGRFVAQKARRAREQASPDKSVVLVVRNGPEALQALLRPGATWVESAVLDALAEACRRDHRFGQSMGDLLQGTNFRRLLPPGEHLSALEREILVALAAGARLRVVPGDPPTVKGWSGPPNVTSQLPAVLPARVFLALSRRKLIFRVYDRRSVSPEVEWEISPHGRRLLNDAIK